MRDPRGWCRNGRITLQRFIAPGKIIPRGIEAQRESVNRQGCKPLVLYPFLSSSPDAATARQSPTRIPYREAVTSLSCILAQHPAQSSGRPVGHPLAQSPEHSGKILTSDKLLVEEEEKT